MDRHEQPAVRLAASVVERPAAEIPLDDDAGEGAEVYTPPVDPVGNNREVIGGFQESSMESIEVERSEMALLIDEEMSRVVTDGLRKIGYTYVTLDLLGYRSGSMNEGFLKKKKA